MIRHFLSMLGCAVAIIVGIYGYFFGVRENESMGWMAIGCFILLLLVYWNYKMEIKKVEIKNDRENKDEGKQ